MFTTSDLKQIEERGSVLDVVNVQIENFKKGFPFLKLQKAATPGEGIIILKPQEIDKLIADYDAQAIKKEIVKLLYQ